MQSYLTCTRIKVVNIFVGGGWSSGSEPGTGYKYRSVFSLISLFLASALFPLNLLAHSSSSISGTVVDSSGAAVPDARVVLKIQARTYPMLRVEFQDVGNTVTMRL
jgi:hypothetical protein